MNMRKKTLWNIVGIGVVAVILLLGIEMLVEKTGTRSVPVEQTKVAEEERTVTLTIEGSYVEKVVTFSPPKTVLEILEQQNETDGNVRLVTKEYPGLGTLVESIGGIANGENGEYWQYNINGEMPQIGADQLQVENGDVIDWYFEASEF